MRGKDCKSSLLALSFCFLAMCTAAQAGTVTFNFSSIASGSTDATVSSVLTGQLGAGKSVAVTGVYATNSWNGDGHVLSSVNTLSGQNVGTNGSNASSTTFLMNNNQTASSNDILMTFTGLQVTGISFNLEIFPDNSCASSSTCGTGTPPSNLPDFTFVAGSFSQTWNAAFPAGCQASHAMTCETAAQLAPTASGNLTFAATNTLDFQDWPAEIGINNVTITYNTPTPTPEPGSLFLFGTGLSGIAAFLRKQKIAK